VTARTVQYHFARHNKGDKVKVWNRTHDAFLMRQSYLDTRVWMALNPLQANANLAIAAVEERAD
jgi:hypothetical protein